MMVSCFLQFQRYICKMSSHLPATTNVGLSRRTRRKSDVARVTCNLQVRVKSLLYRIGRVAGKLLKRVAPQSLPHESDGLYRWSYSGEIKSHKHPIMALVM
eukprot:jgi/Botrbrau1/7743/Bobra.0159s0173.1